MLLDTLTSTFDLLNSCVFCLIIHNGVNLQPFPWPFLAIEYSGRKYVGDKRKMKSCKKGRAF